MTILLTKCPYCDSNFMMLDTEGSRGQCVSCSKERTFSIEEIAEAESRRDKLSEKYLGRLEEAFRNKDLDRMKPMVEEVAMAGISSWYAWLCVGWADMEMGSVGQAFDDFKLAALFIDEENYDEFYESVMEITLDSLEKTVREGKEWGDENTSMVDFTGTLFERFEHLSDQDFMCDLMLRIGTLSDSIDTALMGGDLIKEIMMMVLDYMSGNTYVLDHMDFLNNAKSAVDSIDEAMKAKAQDKTMSPKTVEIWGSGFSEFIQMLIDGEGKLLEKASDQDLLALCDYWGVNDYEDVFNLLQTAFESHTGYVLSGKRNKGIKKKRDQALADYLEAFGRPLVQGFISPDSEAEDYDRICPDCGRYLNADEDGLMVCECGFKSRMATDDIEDLPENVQELVIMGRKAIQDKDSRMLNNLGERILEFEQDNWHGYTYLAASCALDGQLCESLMLVVQAANGVPREDAPEFKDLIVELLGESFSSNDDPEQNMIFVFMSAFYEALDNSHLKECGIPMAIIERMKEGDYRTAVRGALATMVLDSVLHHEIDKTTSLTRIKETIRSLLELLDRVDAGMADAKNDNEGNKDDVENYSKTTRDLLGYLNAKIDGISASSGDERLGYMSGYWASRPDDYADMAKKLSDALEFDPDIAYSPKSKSIKKSKNGIDRFLDSYVSMS